jgi:hypothetical protein
MVSYGEMCLISRMSNINRIEITRKRKTNIGNVNSTISFMVPKKLINGLLPTILTVISLNEIDNSRYCKETSKTIEHAIITLYLDFISKYFMV